MTRARLLATTQRHAAENLRLRAQLRQAHATIAALDARLAALQKANESLESRRFKTRPEMVA